MPTKAKTRKAPAPAEPVPAPAPTQGPPPEEYLGRLPLGDIRPCPFNPRKCFPADDIEALAGSIRALGLKDRLLVRPVAAPGKELELRDGCWLNVGHYELVDGERRFRALSLIDDSHEVGKVPVVVRRLTDAQARSIMVASREQSRELLAGELAAGYAAMLADGKTVERIAAEVGESAGHVRSVLRLGRLPAFALEAVDSGRLPRSVAELVARVPGEKARAECAARVIAGDPYGYAPGEKAPKPDEDGPMTYRVAEDFIARHFQVELKQASFGRKALDLVEGAGSCDDCPKRAGNDPEAKAAGTRADVCLDPACFRAKTEAHNKRALAAAKATGRTVLPAKEADKLFAAWGEHRLSYGSGYVDLDAKCHESGANGRTYRSLLKAVPAEKVVVAVDPSGAPRELVRADAAAKVLREEHKIGARSTSVDRDSSYAREQAKLRKKAEAGKLAQRSAIARAAEVMEKAFAPVDGHAFAGAVPLLRRVAAAVSDFAGADACRAIAGRRGLAKEKFGDRGAVAKLAEGLSSPRELVALIAECAAARMSWGWGSFHYSGHQDKDEVAFWAAFGVDRKKLFEAAQAAQADQKKVAKPDKAKTKPAGPPKPRKPPARKKSAEEQLEDLGLLSKPGERPPVTEPVGDLPLIRVDGFPASVAHALARPHPNVKTLADLGERVEGYEVTKPAGPGDGTAAAVYETIVRLVGFDGFLATAARDAVMKHLRPGWKAPAATPPEPEQP